VGVGLHGFGAAYATAVKAARTTDFVETIVEDYMKTRWCSWRKMLIEDGESRDVNRKINVERSRLPEQMS
jgi:hypothetical protein